MEDLSTYNFDVILPIHDGVRPCDFKAAFNSVYMQSLKATLIIISVDGPLGKSLSNLVYEYKTYENVKVVTSKHNRGAGHARALAIVHSISPLLVLMDSDDISVNTRFEKQVEFIKSSQADVVGGMIAEFDNMPGDTNRKRIVPLKHDEIRKQLKWKQSMNNVTLMFRRSLYDRAGGYNSIPFFEDYDLIVRMMIAGGNFANQPDILVNVRTGSAFLGKRRGLHYIVQEQKHFLCMYRNNYISKFEYAMVATVRFLARILPSRLLGYIYKLGRNL